MESRDCRLRAKLTVNKSNELYGCCRNDLAGSPKYPGRHMLKCADSQRCRKEKGEEKRVRDSVEISQHYGKLTTMAKRLHAANLQHQPLPDRVDDRIFVNAKSGPYSANCVAEINQKCAKISAGEDLELGYRKPKTRMDLAICWETPIDPVYEPRRPTHVDGTEGGSAPAIFALIQHTSVSPKNHELLPRVREAYADDDRAGGRQTSPKRTANPCCCCCEPLCDGIKTVAVAENGSDEKSRSASAPSSLRITERRCVASKPRETLVERREIRDPRLIRSAVNIALGLEKKVGGARRSGLPPAKIVVPRPRTPFAKRSFCIDTLAPPFSITDGCRDADYPEHWRLMSVYQQSYKNPQKRKVRYF